MDFLHGELCISIVNNDRSAIHSFILPRTVTAFIDINISRKNQELEEQVGRLINAVRTKVLGTGNQIQEQLWYTGKNYKI